MKTETASKALSLSELYDGVQAAIWSELRTGGDISLMRRNLQREHVKRLVQVLTRADSGPADVRALQRENARALVAQLKAAQGRPGLSKEAKAHLADSLDTLEEALKAPLIRNNA
jgi:hypothetical protein